MSAVIVLDAHWRTAEPPPLDADHAVARPTTDTPVVYAASRRRSLRSTVATTAPPARSATAIRKAAAITDAHQAGDILIDPYDPARLSPNAYDWRLGEQIRTCTGAPGDVLDAAVPTEYTETTIPATGMEIRAARPVRVYPLMTFGKIVFLETYGDPASYQHTTAKYARTDGIGISRRHAELRDGATRRANWR